MTTLDLDPLDTPLVTDLRPDPDPAPSGSARLLAGLRSDGAPVDLATHRRTYPAPHLAARRSAVLLDEIERSGLRGRGGAAFPTAVKLRAVAGRAGAAVVVNATEGEPASAKDALLLATVPHLVIDGALVAAAAVGATSVTICIARDQLRLLDVVHRAVAERRAHHEPLPDLTVEASPLHFVVGEETALVHWLSGGDALPTGTRPTERGLDGRPTVVDNAETVAHLAQIARFGADWFRAVGTSSDPGTLLATVTLADGSRRVVEAASGTPMKAVVEAAGGSLDGAGAVLVGGYFGAWITGAEALAATLANDDLRHVGASVGCGVIAPMPAHACGWCETARLLRWMAGESAGQCGVCVNGLPAIARVATELAEGSASSDALAWLHRWAGQIEGRGGCRLPDGAVRLLRSALRVHGHLVDQHRGFGGCPTGAAPFLPVPDHRSQPWR